MRLISDFMNFRFIKRTVIMFVIALVACAGCNKEKDGDDGPGDGSTENPFKVSNAAMLVKVGSGADGWDLDSHYIQTADITLTEEWVPIGIYEPEEKYGKMFIGMYDGGGYAIKNLTINNTEAGYYGMFAAINKNSTAISDVATVKNLALIDVRINGKGVCGGIAGVSFSRILNCYVTGSIRSTEGDAGGVVGESFGVIRNCYSTCNVTSQGKGGIAGGIAGSQTYGEIKNCYATGNISGYDYVGGVVGFVVSRSIDGTGYITIVNNVALNGSISASSGKYAKIGRMVGINSSNFGPALSRNYARIDMAMMADNVVRIPDENGIDKKDGFDVAKDDYSGINSSMWWSERAQFRDDVWTFEANKLPVLKGFNVEQSPQAQ